MTKRTNVIVMSMFTEIVKKYYDNKLFRESEALKEIKTALCEPEKLCPTNANIDPDEIYKAYDEIKIPLDGDWSPYDIDGQQIENDILSVADEITTNKDFGTLPFVIAGQFLELLDNKLFSYYDTEQFAEKKDDSYFLAVFCKKMKYYKSETSKCDSDKDSNLINVSCSIVDVKEIVQQVKKEVYEEIIRELPKAFEKFIFTNKK